MKRNYFFNITPRWILYSGLPQQLNKKYGCEAWPIFHCLIQADCRFNPDYPDTFDLLFEEIADFTGITRRTVGKYIEAFEKGELLRVRRGVRGRKSMFKLANPIKTPKSPKDIRALDGGLLGRRGRQPILRYADYGKDVPLIEERIRGKIRNNYGKDTQRKGKDVPTNKRKEEERRRDKQQGRKSGIVAPSFSKGKPREPNLLQRIIKLGIKKDRAIELLESYPHSKIKEQLEWLPHRKNIRNPAGAFMKAVEQDWAKPVNSKTKVKEGWKESRKYRGVYEGYWEDQKALLQDIKRELKKYGISEERLEEWKEELDLELHPELDECIKILKEEV